MSSVWGRFLKISVFGESHGEGIGVVVDGLPAGIKIDFDEIAAEMVRRSPKASPWSTSRKEEDVPEIMSGVYNGYTTGSPICAVIYNRDQRSNDYSDIADIPRPGHADYTGRIRYNGFNDPRGGGHFSGRLTAPIVFAGALCRQYLKKYGVEIGAHIYNIEKEFDVPFDPCEISAEELRALRKKSFSVVSDMAGERMTKAVLDAKKEGDSVGGVIECAAVGLPCGIGSPIFGGVEPVLSSILFAVPAVKGVEFGAGFEIAEMRGSKANDPYIKNGERITCSSNNNGGVLGGITDGMPLLLRVAIKPTPSVSCPQSSVDLKTMEEKQLVIPGRHDTCIVPRAVCVVEAACAVALTDILLEARGYE